MTRDEAVGLVVRSLPYPAQITDWDTASEDTALRFTWRGARYRFAYATSWLVEEVEDCILCGSDQAILIEHTINLTYVNTPVVSAALNDGAASGVTPQALTHTTRSET